VHHLSIRRLAVLTVLLALLSIAIWYWTRPQPVTVRVQSVETGTVTSSVANTRAGTLKACRRARLSPPSGGQVDRLKVREGDYVETGQLLLALWNEDLRAELRLAESELTASRSRTEESCLTAEKAKREADRLRPLRQKNLVSIEQLDQAVTESLARAAACRAAKGTEQVNEARVAVAQAALVRTILRAPFAGVVAEVTGEVGEIVTPSPPGIITPPAIDLIDCSCVYVSAPIDEVDAPAIRVGMPTRITLDAFPNQVFPGTVRRIAPYVLDLEKQARTVEVEVAFTDADRCGGLLPGYSADIEVILESHDKVLRIPTEAVLEDNRVLLLGDDGLLYDRHFQPGLRNWSFTEVLAGLKVGERVVISVDRIGVKEDVPAVVEP
jgi:HlyD family secretion protein